MILLGFLFLLVFCLFSFSSVFVSFDLSRCDAAGSPHRRILACESASLPLHSTGVMDFRYFPSGSSSHGNTHTLVAALRNGDVNVMDLRVPNGHSSTGAQAAATGAKLFKPQQRATVANAPAASGTSNPPCSLQLSSCGNKLWVFTEAGILECWDTRLMRAGFERVLLLDSLWNSTNAPAPGPAAAGAAAPSPLVADDSLSNSLGLQHTRSPLRRICSTAMHPQDDQCLLFQLLSGAVGLLDLNPSSRAYNTCRTVVAYESQFVTANLDDFALRQKRTATFLHNGQVGSTASASREKTMAVANLHNEVQIIESCYSHACASPPPRDRAPSAAVGGRASLLSRDPMLQRELARSSDRSNISSSGSHIHSSSMHVLCTVPRAVDDSVAPDSWAAAVASSSNPIMSLAAHPSVPYLLAGYKQQRVRIIAHQSELEEESVTVDDEEPLEV